MAIREFYAAPSLHTEMYDAMAAATLAASSASGDIEFFRGLAAETGGPVLEIGSGTGRVSIPLAEDGHEVVGVDVSTAMLAVAEGHRAALPAATAARLTFREGDMATLDLGRRFALILAPSRVFQFMRTSADQRLALRALRGHLAPGGRLVLDLFDPNFDYVVPSKGGMPRGFDLHHPRTGNRVTVAVTGRWPEPDNQLIVEEWTFNELDADGNSLRTDTERLTLRWSTRAEMRLLLELEGLDVLAEYGDFAGGPPAYGAEQVWVLRQDATATPA
jgi:SAM-dependent methyltransferase